VKFPEIDHDLFLLSLFHVTEYNYILIPLETK